MLISNICRVIVICFDEYTKRLNKNADNKNVFLNVVHSVIFTHQIDISYGPPKLRPKEILNIVTIAFADLADKFLEAKLRWPQDLAVTFPPVSAI